MPKRNYDIYHKIKNKQDWKGSQSKRLFNEILQTAPQIVIFSNFSVILPLLYLSRLKNITPQFFKQILFCLYKKGQVKGVQLGRADSAKKSYPGKRQKVPNRSISHQYICFLHYMQTLWYQRSCRTMSTIPLKVLLIRGRLTLLCIQRILGSMRKHSMSLQLLRHILANNWKGK